MIESWEYGDAAHYSAKHGWGRGPDSPTYTPPTAREREARDNLMREMRHDPRRYPRCAAGTCECRLHTEDS